MTCFSCLPLRKREIEGDLSPRLPLRPQHRTATRKLPKLATLKQRQLPPDGTALCAGEG